MVEVRNNGVPLVQQAPKAAITQSIDQLADALERQDRRRSQREADGKEPQLAQPLAGRSSVVAVARACVSRRRCAGR